MRKIIQILERYEQLYALCDDGTIWRYVELSSNKVYWYPILPEIPQVTDLKALLESLQN